MSIPIKLTLLTVLTFIPCTAFAAQSWDCSFNDTNQTQVITKYTLNGDFLVDNKGIKYQVLKNNDLSIIAASSVSEMRGPADTRPSIGATTVIINLKNMHYNIAYLVMDGNQDSTAGGSQSTSGDCIKN
jgi:hypothetical protein